MSNIKIIKVSRSATSITVTSETSTQNLAAVAKRNELSSDEPSLKRPKPNEGDNAVDKTCIEVSNICSKAAACETRVNCFSIASFLEEAAKDSEFVSKSLHSDNDLLPSSEPTEPVDKEPEAIRFWKSRVPSFRSKIALSSLFV